MLTLNDGRNELWQWDTGRKLEVDVDCSQVHFSNKVFGRSIDVDVVDGVAAIPDILLQTDKELNVWAFVGTAENGYTKISKVFKVNKRNKPANYVFTPTEQTTLGQIMERLDDLEAMQDPDAIKNAVDDYLANNPIMVNETDPTVPEWAKQPTPPDVKIPDKLPNPNSITFTGAVDASYDGSNPVEIKIPDSGGNVDLTGYATEQYVQEYAQPKGEYLTAVPEGYAKTEDIPTKPEDIGAQPVGNYLTEVPSDYATKEFVTNKIAEAELGGEEVDLSGYAQKSELPTKVSQLQNDSGYLTAVPDGYAKTEDIPKNASDIGAQPEGDYALRSEIPAVPVKSVNGKTGAVSLTATDVKARPDTWMPSASDVGALPNTTKIPAKTSDLTNDSGFITGYTETDPTVPAWAKNATKPSYTASEVGALPSTTKIPSKTSDLTNDSGFITGYTETDPTVPSWAKASTKPSYSKSEVGLGNVDNVKQYSASNPPPYPVTSVNGKTGAVSLTIPTVPTKVSAFTNDAGYLTESDKPDIVAMVIESLGGNPIFGVVDSNNHIVLNGDLPDGTYSVKYEMENGSSVNIGNLVLDTNVYYTVTNNLTNCTSNNSATQAVQGGSYSATITAVSGYELKSVTVTMGGSPVTVSGGVINIANVTGNIVITAVAEEKVVEPAYTNFADPTSADWKTEVRLTTDIDHTTSLTGGVATNYISVQEGDTLEVTGINIADSNSRTAYWFNSTSNSILKASQLASGPALSDVSYDANSLICTVAADCESNARMRFSGLATGTSADVVIKIKRNGAYL